MSKCKCPCGNEIVSYAPLTRPGLAAMRCDTNKPCLFESVPKERKQRVLDALLNAQQGDSQNSGVISIQTLLDEQNRRAMARQLAEEAAPMWKKALRAVLIPLKTVKP